ncbi:MAG: prepilin-type cleavage/methylation domain-containing protein [Burkholderiales bacterium PBB3]|nr:MAG: prepilin-type cleavage/methylation domain-containing protein [Burkholderiales bacterium PBB3]
MRTRTTGFTLIELLVVIAVMAILALMVLPTFQGKMVRDQIIEGAELAKIAKAPIATMWQGLQQMPKDNAAVGLPAAEKVVSTMVTSLTVEDGAIHITFGNQANAAIKGKVLTLRPAVVEDAPIVPVSWLCGHAPVPDKMTAKGQDKTDIPAPLLPLNCRAK